MTKKFRQLSLQAKMSSIFILVNLVVFAVTVILILGINSMSSEIDMVYQGNLRLNELSDALTAVQDSMTEYLDSKTSDSLEEFYRSEQIYAQMVQGLSDDVTEATFRRMERSIRHMSEEYLDLVGQTIEAKRGRNGSSRRRRQRSALRWENRRRKKRRTTPGKIRKQREKQRKQQSPSLQFLPSAISAE